MNIVKRVSVWMLIVLIMLEVALRVFGIYNTYSENIGKGYQSYYNKTHDTWYINYTPNSDFETDNGDFKYHYHSNSFGLRSSEFGVPALDSSLRILTLGDSFTEGVGAPVDSSWPMLLESDLKQQGYAVKVYNAGMSGSDPFYAYTFMRDKLMMYNPDNVILAINSSDFTDYLFRGGFERFNADSTTTNRPGPWFEPLWAHCHVVRFFMHVCLGYKSSNLFGRRSDMASEYRIAADKLIEACDSISVLAQIGGGNFTVVLHPSPSETMYKFHTISIGGWSYTYSTNATKTLGNAFKQIENGMKKRNVPVINLWDSFDNVINRNNYLQYTYEHDRHFNSTGYKVMENFILNGLQQQNPIIRPIN